MQDDDDLISPEAQRIIDEVNNPKKPVSTTAINLKAKDQGSYLKKRANFTKKIKLAKVHAAKVILKDSKKFQAGKISRKQLNKKLNKAIKPFKHELKKWHKAKTQFVVKHAPRKYVNSFLKKNHEKRKIHRIVRQLHRARKQYKKLLRKSAKLSKKHGKGHQSVTKIDAKIKKLDSKMAKLSHKRGKLVKKFNSGVIKRMKMGIRNLKKISKTKSKTKMNIKPIISQQSAIIKLRQRDLIFDQIEVVERQILRAKKKIAWCGLHRKVKGVSTILTRNVKKLHFEEGHLARLRRKLTSI